MLKENKRKCKFQVKLTKGPATLSSTSLSTPMCPETAGKQDRTAPREHSSWLLGQGMAKPGIPRRGTEELEGNSRIQRAQPMGPELDL